MSIAGAMSSAQVFRPWLLRGHLEATHRARHAGRAPALKAVARRVALCVEVHVVGRRFRRGLAEVDERVPAVGQVDGHVAAAAEVAGEGMCDGQRETDRHGCVHGVTARLQDLEAGIGAVFFHGDDHAVPGMNRLTRGERNGEDEWQQEGQDASELHLDHLPED